VFGRRKDVPPQAAPSEEVDDPTRPQTIDGETGLGNHRQLNDLLRREIARSQRYGDRSAIVVFDVRIVGFRPTDAEPDPPSPATFIARTLLQQARESDVVVRLDLTHFVTFLTESDARGADIFTERVRTAISSAPFARNLNGNGIYARAWAGYVDWQPEYTTPASYVAAAMDALERSRPEYRSAEAHFAGPATRQAS